MICDAPNCNIQQSEIDAFQRKYDAMLDPEWIGVTHLSCRGYAYSMALHNASLSANDIVLDVGGACSYFTPFISPLVKEVHVVDNLTFECGLPWVETMKTLEQRLGLKLYVKKANARELPYPDETFDKVFSFSALEHFDGDEDIECIREIYRVLKPGGLFAGTVDYNAITERPRGEDDICKTYTLRSFFERIVLPADFWPVGDVNVNAIPDVVIYINSPLFFVLSKGTPPGRILKLGGGD